MSTDNPLRGLSMFPDRDPDRDTRAPSAIILDVIVGLAVAMLITAPVNALLTTALLDALWSWFLAEAYGPGPSRQAWFGIACISTVLFLSKANNDAWSKKYKSLIWIAILSSLYHAIMIGFVALTAYTINALLW